MTDYPEKIRESQKRIKTLLRGIGKAEKEIHKGADIKVNKQRIITFKTSVSLENTLILEYGKKLSPE